jgi:hypothetical protein
MEKYGFSLVSREEAKQMGLPEGSGMFIELYNAMLSELKKDPRKESDFKDAPFMKQYEKDISFLNRFFVYKKTSTRNAEKLTRALIEQLPDEYDFEQVGTMLAREAVKEAEAIVKPKAKKIGKKLKLQDAVVEEDVKQEQVEVPQIVRKPRTKKVKEVEVEPINPNENVVLEAVEFVPKTKPKKTTRKKKEIEFVIEGEEKADK